MIDIKQNGVEVVMGAELNKIFNFEEAIQYLLDGYCIGLLDDHNKPIENRFLRLEENYISYYINGNHYMLVSSALSIDTFLRNYYIMPLDKRKLTLWDRFNGA